METRNCRAGLSEFSHGHNVLPCRACRPTSPVVPFDLYTRFYSFAPSPIPLHKRIYWPSNETFLRVTELFPPHQFVLEHTATPAPYGPVLSNGQGSGPHNGPSNGPPNGPATGTGDNPDQKALDEHMQINWTDWHTPVLVAKLPGITLLKVSSHFQTNFCFNS